MWKKQRQQRPTLLFRHDLVVSRINTICLFLVLSTSTVLVLVESISLSTKTSVSNQSPIDVHSFLATPANWPKIVVSSVAVQSSSSSPTTTTTDVSKPYRVGDEVEEIFGLPPILPIKVQWTCSKSILPTKIKPGRLEFDSPNGLKGIASNCRMVFDIYSEEEQQQQGADSLPTSSSSYTSVVDLTMEYKPMSPIGILAIPVLTVDNAFALKVLLPWTMNNNNVENPTKSSELVPLDKFRRLMGTLYGIAGLAHLLDCTIGPSQLLTMSGSQPFYMLPLEGQIYAIIWCLMGPLSFVLSRIQGAREGNEGGGSGNLVLADLGLVLYGLVETVGAGLISMNNDNILASDPTTMDPFINVVLTQVVVALAWVYSSQQKLQTDDQAPSP